MSTQSERFNCMKSQRDEARARITQLKQSLVFEIDDGMGSRVGLEGDPDLGRLVELMWPLHEVGGSIIGCAINRIEKGQRDAVRVMELKALLTPRRIDEDTPDGVLVWCSSVESWVDDDNAQHYQGSPTWWLPMLPAPEGD